MSTQTPLRRRITPSVPFVLQCEDANGDKFSFSFRISYDLNAFALIEQETGLSMFANMGDVFDNPTVRTLSVVLWAGLQENHPEWAGKYGLEVLRANLTVGECQAALKACTDAFLAQLPKDKQAEIKRRMEALARGENPGPLAQPPTTA